MCDFKVGRAAHGEVALSEAHFFLASSAAISGVANSENDGEELLSKRTLRVLSNKPRPSHRASNTAWQIEVLATKPCNLCLIPRIQMMKEN